MNQVNCPVCDEKCVKSGKTKTGSQCWLCKSCKSSLTHKINNEKKELQMFLEWLFGKNHNLKCQEKEELSEQRLQNFRIFGQCLQE